MNDYHNWAEGHLLALRIIGSLLIGKLISKVILVPLLTGGFSPIVALILVFAIMLCIGPLPYLTNWKQSELPFGPKDWRDGPRARAMIIGLTLLFALSPMIPFELILFAGFSAGAIILARNE